MMTTNQTPKRPVKAISFQEKLIILRQLEAGVSRKEICETFKCCQSTLSRVLLTKHTILELAEQDKNLNRKRVAMVTYKEIDEALSRWAKEMKRNNVMITAATAKEKAEEIAQEMGQDFKPSAGWLYKWKERENVQFGKKPKVADQLIASMGNEDILKGLLEREERPFESEQIKMPDDYNDEANCCGSYSATSYGNLNSSVGFNNTDIETKKFLPHNKYQNKQIKMPEDYNDEANCRGSDSATFYGNLNNSFDFNNTNIDTKKCLPISTTTTTTTTPPQSAKKVPYSYDPVYVLTSTGRYRKEKTFLTLLQKLEILQRLKNGEKRPDLIIEYRLSQSAMSQIVADEKKILKLAAIGQNLQMKRVRGGIFKGGESELNTWVLKKIEEGETLTRTQIKNKAKEIADRLHIDFKASTGWLEKWKARMNMDFNENQILHRKIPSYISNTDEETHISDGTHIPEAIYGDDDDDEQMDDQVDVKRELAEVEDYSFEDVNEHDVDIKPIMEEDEQFFGVAEVEPEDVKPVVNVTPTTPPATPNAAREPPVVTETLHQKILNWLSRHNVGPTAAIELLTILHPVIAEQSENTQTRHQHITPSTHPELHRRQPYS